MTLRKTFLAAMTALALPISVWAQQDITVHDNLLDADETIGLPEGMLIDEDSLLSDWQAKNYLFPDTTCENPNYNPTYAPEVYRERLQRLPTVVEMTYNEIVQKFIDRYCGTGRRQVSVMLGAANLYVPFFEQSLDEYGLPLELKFLPVIESALNPGAVSPAGAAGLWQLMLATGKQYNLQVDSRVDERRDPIKSTDAAARLLRDLFKIYGDWHLVLAAYNCGPGNVNKAIHRAGGERNYWKIYPYLPKETRGYVPAFIAATYVMNYYCDHNICPMRTKYPLQTDTVMVSSDVDLRQISNVCDVDMAIVKALNPQYKTNVVPGAWMPCAIRLPQTAMPKFITMEQNIRSGVAQTYVNEFAQQTLDPVNAENTRRNRPEVKPMTPTAPVSTPSTSSKSNYTSKPAKGQTAAEPIMSAKKTRTTPTATVSKAKPVESSTPVKNAKLSKNNKDKPATEPAAPARKAKGVNAGKGKSAAEPAAPAKNAKVSNARKGKSVAAESSATTRKAKGANAGKGKSTAEPAAPAKNAKVSNARKGKSVAAEPSAPARKAKGANAGKGKESAKPVVPTKGSKASKTNSKTAPVTAKTPSKKGKK